MGIDGLISAGDSTWRHLILSALSMMDWLAEAGTVDVRQKPAPGFARSH